MWDADLKGFGLLVLPSGVKSYVFNHRTPEGRERRATIGKHGSVTPDQARDKAEQLRLAVSAGRDPLGEKQERRTAPTVGDVLDAYLASERFAAKAPSTQAIDRGRIERHLRTLLGRTHVHTLTPGGVERAFAAIRVGRTATVVKTRARGKARVTGGEGTAREAIHLLRAVLAWGVREGSITTNSAETVRGRRQRNARVHPRRRRRVSAAIRNPRQDGAREAHPPRRSRCDPLDRAHGRSARRGRRLGAGVRRLEAGADHVAAPRSQDRPQKPASPA